MFVDYKNDEAMMKNFNLTSKELIFDSVRLKHFPSMFLSRCATFDMPMASIKSESMTAVVSFIYMLEGIVQFRQLCNCLGNCAIA
jgi:hypothetical protein